MNHISPYMVFCLEQVDTYNLVAVGGSAPTVSPSGYVMGGGHAPITRKLGLGVDQVLEMTVVMADGSLVTISQSGESLCPSVCLSFCLSVSVSFSLSLRSLKMTVVMADGSVVTVSQLGKCVCLSVSLSPPSPSLPSFVSLFTGSDSHIHRLSYSSHRLFWQPTIGTTDLMTELILRRASNNFFKLHTPGGTVVKPNGDTEDLDDNGDLWWSLLGGGGGVFGIVTQFKWRLHDPPPDGVVRMIVTFPVEWLKPGCVGIAEQVRYFLRQCITSDLNSTCPSGRVTCPNVIQLAQKSTTMNSSKISTCPSFQVSQKINLPESKIYSSRTSRRVLRYSLLRLFFYTTGGHIYVLLRTHGCP